MVRRCQQTPDCHNLVLQLSWSMPANTRLPQPGPPSLQLCWSMPANIRLPQPGPPSLQLCWSMPVNIRLPQPGPPSLQLCWSMPVNTRLPQPGPPSLQRCWSPAETAAATTVLIEPELQFLSCAERVEGTHLPKQVLNNREERLNSF